MQNHPVAIFWDYGTTPLKGGVSGYHIAKALWGVGSRYGLVRSFRTYIDYDNQRRSSFGTLRRELHSSGVSLIDCPSSQKDLADKTIIVDMMTLAWDHPPPYTIVLATNDSDLSYALAILRFRGYKIVIVCPSKSDPLAMQSDSVVNWNQEILGLGDEDADDGSSTTSESSSSSTSNGDNDPAPQNHQISGHYTGLETAAALADAPDPIEVKPPVKPSTPRIPTNGETQPHQDSSSKVSLSQAVSSSFPTRVAGGTPTSVVMDSVTQATSHRNQANGEVPQERIPADSGDIPLSTASPATPILGNPSQPSLTSSQGTSLPQERAHIPSFFPPPPIFPLDSVPPASEFRSTVNPDLVNQESDDRNSSTDSQLSGYSIISQPAKGTSSQAFVNAVPSHISPLSNPMGSASIPPRDSPTPHTFVSVLPSEAGMRPEPIKPQPAAAKPASFRPVTPAGPSSTTATPGPSKPSPIPAQVNGIRDLPKEYHVLVQHLQIHLREGRTIVDPGTLAVETDPAFWKGILGYSKFKRYAARAEKAGIVTLSQNNYVSLKPEWHDVEIP